jgi:hypothetical protein
VDQSLEQHPDMPKTQAWGVPAGAQGPSDSFTRFYRFFFKFKNSKESSLLYLIVESGERIWIL